MSAPPTDFDRMMLRRAIRLAMNGRGRVEPNPMVGCVLVKNERIIGEGWHTHFGGPHAEPAALADCLSRGHSPASATAYVTLEPCCHSNKKTPPCAPRLIEAKLARVVVGCLDPNPEVNGNGVAMLRAAGMEVVAPVLEAEAKQLIAPFLLAVNPRRPYVTLKWAETADGKVAGPGGKPIQISNEMSSRLVHRLRAASDAILVGINTVLCDDPLLTARGVEYARPLMRVVLDTDLQTPLTSRLIATAADDVTLFCSGTAVILQGEKVAALQQLRVRIRPGFLADAPHRSPLSTVIRNLGPLSHVLVETGPTLAKSFFADGAADRVWVFRSDKRVDSPSAPSAPRVPDHFVKVGELSIANDTLTEYLNPQSEAFFAPVPSADFILAS